MRRIPTADNFKLGRPAGRIEAQSADGGFKIPPMLSRRGRRLELAKCPQGVGTFGDAIKKTSCGTWPNARQQLGNSKACNPVPHVLRPTQDRKDILDVSGLQEFEPAEFHKGNVSSR